MTRAKGSESRQTLAVAPVAAKFLLAVGVDEEQKKECLKQCYGSFCDSFGDTADRHFLSSLHAGMSTAKASKLDVARIRSWASDIILKYREEKMEKESMIDDESDINDPPPHKDEEASAQLDAEMRAALTDASATWTTEKPFYVKRSTNQPDVLLVVTQIGPCAELDRKINVMGKVGYVSIKDLEDPVLVGKANMDDMKNKRALWCWAIDITETSGQVMKMWLSVQLHEKLDAEELKTMMHRGPWKQLRSVSVLIDPKSNKGYKAVKPE